MSITLIRLPIAVLMASLFLLGCSGSSDSASSVVSESAGNNTSSAGDESSDSDSSSTAGDDSSNSDISSTNDTSSNNDASIETGETGNTPNEIAGDNPVESEPATSNQILINFDITVPAYMSDELQVRLTWGDINTTAEWVRDESWAISQNFPTNTTNPLTVTFADSNGAITLGSYESSLRTEASATDTIQITANQFNTDRWDTDGDEVSNLDELMAGTNPLDGVGGVVAAPVQPRLDLVADKTFRISWQPSPNATFYRVLENPDGVSGFSEISENLNGSIQSFDHRVPLYARVGARYILQACNAGGCADSEELIVSNTIEQAIGYLKSSNSAQGHRFGSSLSLSADGNTLAVGARLENGAATGVNGDQNDQSEVASGAVYIFERIAGAWTQQDYLKASNTDELDAFGTVVSLSADGNTLAVGAPTERSNATGINNDQNDNSAINSGAAYVFHRSAGQWQQQAYLKASNSGADDLFAASLALNSDGNTLVVGAPGEWSAATGINGDQSDNSAFRAGAAYVFVRENNIWQQQAYIKASDSFRNGGFAISVALDASGDILAVAAGPTSGSGSGSIYIFARNNGNWEQTHQLVADSLGVHGSIGGAVNLSANGTTLVSSASSEDSAATGVDGNQNDSFSLDSGAVYVFTFANDVWQREAYLKASNTGEEDLFGSETTLSADGNTLAVAALREDSASTGINGNQTGNTLLSSGAVYVFVRSNGVWSQRAYVKASNTGQNDEFGTGLSLSADGQTLAVGATGESSSAVGFDGNQEDDTALSSGAVYLY